VSRPSAIATPNKITRTDEPHDDLFAVRRHLGDSQAPVQQQEKGMCFLVLGKDRRAFRIVTRVRTRQNVIERFVVETGEQRKISNQ
jgi:hypothetical protein